MKVTGDLHLMKKLNKSIILDTIREESPVSRAAISEKTGLNKATVSNLVTELIASGLVCETGPGESSGGRKPVMLLFNNRAGFAVGIDLGVNYILTVLTDLQGTIIRERRTPLREQDLTVERALDRISEAIRWAMAGVPPSPYGVIGIGIGVPGLVNSEGVILSAPNLKWHNLDIRSEIERRFQLPVTVDNEANTGALGEKAYGAFRSAKDMIYVSAGIGIGVGIIVNNNLYRGFSGFSGEMGHMTIHMDGLPCSCGNRGCWELYASEHAILTQAARYLAERSHAENPDNHLHPANPGGKKPDIEDKPGSENIPIPDHHAADPSVAAKKRSDKPFSASNVRNGDGKNGPASEQDFAPADAADLSLDTLIHLAEKGDARIIELFERVGYYLGIGVANVINTFNPELVVIGNRLSLLRPWIETSMLQCVEQRSLPYHHKRVHIEFSNLGMKSAAVGAASLAIQSFFALTKATVEEG